MIIRRRTQLYILPGFSGGSSLSTWLDPQVNHSVSSKYLTRFLYGSVMEEIYNLCNGNLITH